MYRLLTLKIRLCTVFSVLKTTLVQVRHRISSSIRETNLKGPFTTLSNIPTLPEGIHLQLWWQSNLLQSLRRVFDTRGFSSFIDPTAMPSWWAPIRAKQLSMAATARVIWLCTCVRYCPDRGLVYVCPLLEVCLTVRRSDRITKSYLDKHLLKADCTSTLPLMYCM